MLMCQIDHRATNNTIMLHTRHPFNGPFSGTTQVRRYQKGKTNLDFSEARDCEWQWHQLCHMQVCTLPQTNNHTSNLPLCFFTGRTPFLPPNQQHQSTEGKTLYCCYYYYFKEWTWTTGRRKPRGNWLTDVYLKNSHHNRATRKVNLVESFCSMLVVEAVVPLVGIECIFIAVLAMACVS